VIEIKWTSLEKTLMDIPDLHPQPAKNYIPDWYKKTPVTNNKKLKLENNNDYKKLLPLGRTVKTCPSFHDVFEDGIVLLSPCDIFLSYKEGFYEIKISVNSQHITGDFHGPEQFLDHYQDKDIKAVFKINMPYLLQTPKGYSIRQIPYMYADHTDWYVPYGIIDSDNYHEVNPQILYTSEKDEILIKRGEPLCYLVPFKREKVKLTALTKFKSADKLIRKHFAVQFNNATTFRSRYHRRDK
jgi:hypothetical protein